MTLDLSAYDLVPPVSTYSLPSAGTNNTVLGVKTGDGMYVWKTIREDAHEAALLFEHRLLGWLASLELSFRVPVPVATRNGSTLVEVAGIRGMLTPQLAGHHPPQIGPTEAEAIGGALGELDRALSGYAALLQPATADFSDLAHVHPLIPDPFTLMPSVLGLSDPESAAELLAWWRDELASLSPFLSTVYPTLPRQVTHRDLGPANVLFATGRVSAVLDFEFAGPDARALDLAVTLEFGARIGTTPQPWDLVLAIARGYSRAVQLSSAEIEAIPELIRLRDAVSTIYHLGRARSEENAGSELGRIEGMRSRSAWLAKNGFVLSTLVDEAMR